MTPEALKHLINALTQLPGIGEKTASRLAFHILRSEEDYATSLAAAILEAKKKIHFCESCCNITEQKICKICSSNRRDNTIICVVETPEDVMAIEKTGEFTGLYHILHGVLSPLEGKGPETIKIRELIKRLHDDVVVEIIAATSLSVDGEATALYLKKLLAPFNLPVTRIASGLPMGGCLEFADKVTLGRALRGRLPL